MFICVRVILEVFSLFFSNALFELSSDHCGAIGRPIGDYFGDPASFAVQFGKPERSAEHFQKLGLPFPILADDKGELAGKFGIVRNFGIAKIAKRESFLINPQGAIMYHYTSVNTQTHADQVLKDLKDAQTKK